MKNVTLKNGEVWKASDVSEEGSFLVLNKDGGNEVRVPTSNVARIESEQPKKEESGVGAAIIGSLILAGITGGLLS